MIHKHAKPQEGITFSKIYMVFKILPLTVSILGNVQYTQRIIVSGNINNCKVFQPLSSSTIEGILVCVLKLS